VKTHDLIGVFDSGVGGFSVWREIARQMPQESTLYVADQVHVPYGTRSLAEVRAFAEGITRFLLAHGAKIIVIACNTASAAALDYLRGEFPVVPFVGMEPAIKPAVEQTKAGVVGVIATQATFQGELFASLVQRYADPGCVQVLTQVCPGLVEAVEAGAVDDPATETLLRTCLQPLIDAGMDQLVLGCTHYPHLRRLIERVVGPGVTIVDPSAAVARQTHALLRKRHLGSFAEVPGSHTFYSTRNGTPFSQSIALLLPEFGESIAVETLRWRDGTLQVEPTPS